MIDPRLAPYGLTLLRLSLGIMFIAHAWLKVAVFTVPGFGAFMAGAGFPASLALPVIVAEAVGGVALVLGLYARAVSVALLPVLLGALMVHAGNGWVFNAPNGGWEYPAFLIVGALVQALAGDGALALRPTRVGAARPALAAAA
ncbi:DoxX family protein [Roseomonas sp. KE2513]|uniref:DoxX family protein n=1 Tax=Roseomonas sp. KE2513 TaxID=2479202 RepID=UPI0018E022BC|nr:DoxX family protein [Roseomonas sp. KE2513]MBI0535932.1 DoxX family protein [Roseomonas sp. KE2513]